MNKFILYSLGYKGYFAIKNLDPAFFSSIEYIVVGRDAGTQEDYADSLIDYCRENQISIYERLSAPESVDSISIKVAMGWKWIIPLQNERSLIVLHDSLLPKYRGFNPLVTALIEGDEEIGATALFATEFYDEGPIIFQEKVNITYPIKIQQAIELVADNYANILSKIFQFSSSNISFELREQDTNRASYSMWRDESDYLINWHLDAERILRHIHASGFPYDGALTTLNGEPLRILDAEPVKKKFIINPTPGKIFHLEHGNPIVICGKGLIKLTSIEDSKKQLFKISRLRQRFV